jgi:hypothetical protein
LAKHELNDNASNFMVTHEWLLKKKNYALLV